ncbi:ribosomal protein L10e/L16 [Gorgonomyces haynaldii]|nr:ribosomal protein L10e/L16 [Gorgonomyces haynaldii]
MPTFGQKRTAVANYRPKQLKYKKAHKGFFPTHSGGSLKGTTVFKGDYGLQVIEGGRLKDKQLDTLRLAVKRIIKQEKTAEMHMRCFPHRPVTAKGNGARMGSGKGSVDYFATWMGAGRIVLEIGGARKELAHKALSVAAAMLPLRTRIIEKDLNEQAAPRVLPHFIRQRLWETEKRASEEKYTP